jgi:hypothetical protein
LGIFRLTTHQKVKLPVTWSQVASFRLARHHLVQRAPANELISAVYDIAGAQAQLFSAAQISLWARVQDLRKEDIEKVLEERSLAKAACMRRTLFLVPAEHLAVFVRGSARRAEKGIRWALGKGISEHTIEAAIDAVLSVLYEPLTRPEIAERVSRALRVEMQVVHGGGWGSRSKVAAVPVGEITFPVVDLLHLSAARGVVCYGPKRGNEPTFVRADAWIPHWQDVPQDQAEASLLNIYLKAFGPATAADFALWTGMTLREARAIWMHKQADLAPVNVEGWEAEILQEDLHDLVQARLEGPLIRLLPYFDSFLLGHKDRDHLVTMEHRPDVYRAQGWIAPVVLADGKVVAVWEHTIDSNRLCIKVTKFGSLSQHIIATINDEARDLGRFLGNPSVDIQIF